MIKLSVEISESALDREVARIKALLASLPKPQEKTTLGYHVRASCIGTVQGVLLFEPRLEQCDPKEAHLLLDIEPDGHE